MEQVKRLAIEERTAHGEKFKIWMVPNQPSFVTGNTEFIFPDIDTRNRAAEILLGDGYYLIG